MIQSGTFFESFFKECAQILESWGPRVLFLKKFERSWNLVVLLKKFESVSGSLLVFFQTCKRILKVPGVYIFLNVEKSGPPACV